MRLRDVPLEFKRATPVIKRLEEGGFDAYFVGGSVRDMLLGTPIHDVDIATSAYPAEVKGLFQRTVDVGIEHGTVLVLFEEEQYEITTFRTESTYQDYRRPDEVTFVRSLAEDLKRRDFTINALAMDRHGELIDLFDGMADLTAKQIKAVGVPSERFHEDALRMMRALRFSSQLDFEIEAATLKAIKEHHLLLEKISVERLQIEFVKLMMGLNRSRGLRLFIETGCYQLCPGFQTKVNQLTQLQAIPNQPIKDEAVVWLLTLYFLDISPKASRSFLSQWKNSKQLIKQVQLLLSGLTYRLTNQWTPQWLYQLGRANLAIVEASLVYFNQIPQTAKVLAAYDHLPLHQSQDLAISGRDVLSLTSIPAGPWLGALLAQMETKILQGELPNDYSALMTYVKEQL